ncbi:MAG TPA: PAS domain S-box protein [Verrucomicrobiae bacterium]|nr:PAS domain S-box protein [Verrucomicrobiae bacterium]
MSATATNKRLNILHLEDEPDFGELVRSLLAQDFLDADIKRVGDRAEFEQALNAGTFDIIISDFHLPSFNGLQALALVRQKFPHLPFILVSGTIGEQAAIESLKAGATDYLLKQNPDRLPSAIRRAVQEAEEHRALRDSELELARREKYFRALTENSLDVLWILNREGNLTYASPSVERVMGYLPDELFGKNALANVHPEDLSRARAALQIAVDDPKHTVKLEIRYRRKSGVWQYIEIVGQSRLTDPDIAGLVIHCRDITERRQGEHRNAIFSKLGHGLSSATTAAQAAMIICEVADALFDWDGFAIDLYSDERDEVFSLLNIATVDGRRIELPQSAQFKTGSTVVKRVIQRGAELFNGGEAGNLVASTMLAPIRKGNRVIGILFIQGRVNDTYSYQDLDTLQILADHCAGALERLRAEQALGENQQRFRDLFENSPDAIFVDSLDGKVLDVNPAACVLHGFTREQLIGKNSLEELVPPNKREEARKNFEKLVNGDLSRIESESFNVDACAIPVEVRARRVRYDGQPAVLLHVRDITERRAAENALRSSEILFRSVWENSADGMRLTDEKGIVIAVNNSFCKLVSMDAAALEGKPFTAVFSPLENPAGMMEEYRKHFDKRAPQRKIERQFKLHNDKQVTLEITNSFIELHERPLLSLSLFRDVTAQRRLEEQLLQSQKMEAIGQLAGGVAHDFNNILTVIQGHATLLTSYDGLGNPAAKSAASIAQAAERAAGLTRQLLAFSRRHLIQPRRIDLNKVVGNMTNMLGRLLGEDIALQLNYCQMPPTVEADASMMEQMLLNLAVNARDAMPRGGQLGIRITLVEITDTHIRRRADAHPGIYVRISVSDTGSGISSENLPRIFEPFFTTKEIGKGTGLGLATVYGVVKQHQGWIEVESELGKGSTFNVYIPHIPNEVNDAEKSTSQITIRGGDETILIVEDEPPVCELVSRVLRRYGYNILQAGNGAEAVQVWNENKKRVNLLLTDLVMPDNMNGRELAEKLWVESPELKVIFTSGYSADIVGKDFKLEPELNFLQKPYHPQTLALTVRRCLDGKQN